MKSILAMSGSNSINSINKIWANYIANRIENARIVEFDWSKFDLPLYGPDLEKKIGIPEKVSAFNALIDQSDAIVLSLAEYNGLPTPAFKNLWDWTSRLDVKIWGNKPMFLSATSPGKLGGRNVLRVIKEAIPHFGGNLVVDFSLPLFHQNFKEGEMINSDLMEELDLKIQLFQKQI